MRPVSLGDPVELTGDAFSQWALQAFREIENASIEDTAVTADAFTITGTLVETRTLDLTAPTAATVAAVLATFINDLKKRGAKRA